LPGYTAAVPLADLELVKDQSRERCPGSQDMSALHCKENARNCYEGIKGAGSFSSVQ
jgi:hypothetical protein